MGEVEASIKFPPFSPALLANAEPKASSALEAAPVAVEGEVSIQPLDPELAEDEAVSELNGADALERIDAELPLAAEGDGLGMPGVPLDT